MTPHFSAILRSPEVITKVVEFSEMCMSCTDNIRLSGRFSHRFLQKFAEFWKLHCCLIQKIHFQFEAVTFRRNFDGTFSDLQETSHIIAGWFILQGFPRILRTFEIHLANFGRNWLEVAGA